MAEDIEAAPLDLNAPQQGQEGQNNEQQSTNKKIISLQNIKRRETPLEPLSRIIRLKDKDKGQDNMRESNSELFSSSQSHYKESRDQYYAAHYPPSRHLWVGNLTTHVSEDQLHERFSRYGKIESIVKKFEKQYAFVNYYALSDSIRARNAEDGQIMFGAQMLINFGKGILSKILSVVSLDRPMKEDELYFLFKKYGHISWIRMVDNNNALVKFEIEDDAIYAVDAVNNIDIGGSKIQVAYASQYELDNNQRISDDWAPRDRDRDRDNDRDGGDRDKDRDRGDRDRGDRGRDRVDTMERDRDNRDRMDRGRMDRMDRDRIDRMDRGDRGDRDRDRLDRGDRDREYDSGRVGRSAWPGDRPRDRDNRVREDEKAFVKVVPPTSEDDTSRHLWVGNIAIDVTSADLEREFGKFGEVDRARVFYGRGYGFVDFRSISTAVYARKQFNGRYGWIVNFAKGQPSRHLWIGSIHSGVSERYLLDVFSRFGPIEQCKLLQRSNCAFIDFERLESAIAAYNDMQGAQLGGYAIKIDFGMANTNTPTPSTSNSDNNSNNYNNKYNYNNSNNNNIEDNQRSRSLYIAFPHDINPSEHELFVEFSKYSRVESVRCVAEQHYAFVNFETYDGARIALEESQGRILGTNAIKVQYAKRTMSQVDQPRSRSRSRSPSRKPIDQERDERGTKYKESQDRNREFRENDERTRGRDRDRNRDVEMERDVDKDRDKDRAIDKNKSRERSRDRESRDKTKDVIGKERYTERSSDKDSMYLYCKQELEREQSGYKKGSTSLLDLLVNANIDVKVEAKVTNGICKAMGSLLQMSETLQVEWTQRMAESIGHASSHEAQTILPVLFDLFMSLIILPPTRLQDDDDKHPKLSFSVIEASIYSFTILARKSPTWWDPFITSDNKRRLDDRLKYLIERTKHHIQMWEQTYEAFAHTSVLTQGGAQQKNFVSVALKAGNNITLLAKNLLQRSPDLSESLINKINLSFSKDKESTKVAAKPQEQENVQDDRDNRKRSLETVDNSSKKQKPAPATSAKTSIPSPVDVPVSVMFPPASPVSPQGSPVSVSLSDLPQVWKGNLGKGDATVCTVGAKLVVGPALSDEWVQALRATSILAVKDRTPIGDLTAYLQLGKQDIKPRRLSVLNFQSDQTQDQAAFADFIAYLKSKDRAGIVRLVTGKMMYIVPTSPLATMLLDLNPSLATELRGSTSVLLGVLEAEPEKIPVQQNPVASPPVPINPLAFPFLQFPPHMLGMPNMPAGMEGVNMANFPALSGLPMNMFPFVMQNLAQIPQIPTPPPDKNL